MNFRRLVLALPVVCLAVAPALYAATVTSEPWGKMQDGTAVDLYTITDKNIEVKIATYGARIVSLSVPDKDGKMSDIVLGAPDLQGYIRGAGAAYAGSTVGRFANRIAGGQFTLNGKTYSTPKNNGPNTLHGGNQGFDRKVWTARPTKDGVTMSLTSPDGDMGFPGTLAVSVDFAVHQQKGAPALTITYNASTDAATVINLTNHSYFNLANDPSTPVWDDIARIDADKYTPVNTSSIPTGTNDPVTGTPFDFRTAHALGQSVPDRGYDYNWVLNAHKANVAVAEVSDPHTDRDVQVFTDQPGLQLYAPKSAPPPPNSNFRPRPSPQAFTLETQHFPDSPNQPSFPSTELDPGKPFHSTTTFVFSVKKN
jgi:aldose 1-epimerase